MNSGIRYAGTREDLRGPFVAAVLALSPPVWLVLAVVVAEGGVDDTGGGSGDQHHEHHEPARGRRPAGRRGDCDRSAVDLADSLHCWLPGRGRGGCAAHAAAGCRRVATPVRRDRLGWSWRRHGQVQRGGGRGQDTAGVGFPCLAAGRRTGSSRVGRRRRRGWRSRRVWPRAGSVVRCRCRIRAGTAPAVRSWWSRCRRRRGECGVRIRRRSAAPTTTARARLPASGGREAASRPVNTPLVPTRWASC